jgi:hypothetical protein
MDALEGALGGLTGADGEAEDAMDLVAPAGAVAVEGGHPAADVHQRLLGGDDGGLGGLAALDGIGSGDQREAAAAVREEDFATAMSAMAKLRPAVDAFFDKVKVNDDEPKVRENRLKLLNEIRAATRAVADFSKIEG